MSCRLLSHSIAALVLCLPVTAPLPSPVMAATAPEASGLGLARGVTEAESAFARTTRVKFTAKVSRFNVSQVTVRPHVMLSPKVGPPTSTVRVSGSGFRAFRAVNIYFDAKDEALASTNANGAFSGIAVKVPASAVPGKHYITAVQRHSGLSAQAAFTVQANWPQFHNSSDHRGYNTTENVLNPGNVSSIGPVWSYTTGGSPLSSSPAVANGTVYIGANDGKVYALNAATGALKWSHTGGGFDPSSPAVANGLVYIGFFRSKVYALNAVTGALKWSYPAKNNSSPTVADGLVYQSCRHR